MSAMPHAKTNRRTMAETNQLLFNLNTPYNPLNMVTQFYNPGPVVIERLPGQEQPGRHGSSSPETSKPEPVQFTVISKEKLTFAMQLARRDMKNKIWEQQQQHLKQQAEEKQNIPAKKKKNARTRNLQKRTGGMQQPASSPQRRTQNVNVGTRSVKTQTPPPSRYKRNIPSLGNPKGSPILFLQSRPQVIDEFERNHEVIGEEERSRKVQEQAAKSSSNQQKHELARLNKELKNCVERINVLSKQVEDTTVVSSPDRTATLRAGLEALMRAERSTTDEGQRSERRLAERLGSRVTGSSSRGERQRENRVNRMEPRQARGVLIPSRLKRHRIYSESAEVLHFTQPTESTKSKARPLQVAGQRKASRAIRPAWNPPGSPDSLRRTPRKREATVPPRRDRDNASDSSDEGMGRLSEDGKRDSNLRRRRTGNAEGSLTQTPRKGAAQGGKRWTKPPREQQRGQGRSEYGQTEEPSHPVGLPDGRLAGPSGSDQRDSRDSPPHGDQRRKPSMSTARRRVQFDHPTAEEATECSHMHNGRQDDDQMDGQLQGRGSAEAALAHGEDNRTHPATIDVATVSRKHRDPGNGGTQQRCLNHLQKSQSQQSEESKRNTKDHITDLLVDDILEDAVRELERLDGDAVVTRQAQTMADASTFENMLQELELMEVEEERIRQRWKHVRYDDPGDSRSVGRERSLPNHQTWMTGTPLDAQQMERLDEIPRDHTAVCFTQQRSEGRTHAGLTPPHRFPPASSDEGAADGGVGSPMPTIVVSSVARGGNHAPRRTDLTHTLPHDDRASRRGGDVPVFVPADTMKRIRDCRAVFHNHLKRTSHLPYGTFDPWKLVERISDELVDEILGDVTEEVGDVISHYVETLYSSEFNISQAGQP